MDIQSKRDQLWEVFSKTGSVDAYLEYKNIPGYNMKKDIANEYDSEGNSAQAKQLW